MKNKIIDYLKIKGVDNYNELDKIYDMYASGIINKLLSHYESVHIYPSLDKKNKTIQIHYSYNNINVGIDFFENDYDVVIYHTGISIDEFEKSFIKYNYNECFNLKALIESIDEKIRNHPKLKNMSKDQKKKKMYSMIAWINFSIPMVTMSLMALYVFITGNSIQAGPYFAFIIFVPLLIWFIFDIKSRKL